MSRDLIEKRDKIIGSIVFDLSHIKEHLEQLFETVNFWPIVARGPIDELAYHQILDLLDRIVEQPKKEIIRKVYESKRINDEIQEIIRRAYE